MMPLGNNDFYVCQCMFLYLCQKILKVNAKDYFWLIFIIVRDSESVYNDHDYYISLRIICVEGMYFVFCVTFFLIKKIYRFSNIQNYYEDGSHHVCSTRL